MNLSNPIKAIFSIVTLILLVGCSGTLLRTVDDLKPVPYDQGTMETLPYEFEDVVSLVRQALESKEAKLVIKEEQTLEDGMHVFYARTTFMKMDFDPGAIVRVVVERGGEQGDKTYLRVIKNSLTYDGVDAFNEASDYTEIIVMQVDSVLKSSEMEDRYKDLE